MDGRGCHLVRSDKQQTPTLVVGYRQPAHLLFGTMLLRQDIFFVLVSNGTVIDGRQTGFLAVAIAVPWATTKPAELFHFLEQF